VSAELAARRTAAAAALADFGAANDAYLDDPAGQTPRPDYGSWAYRLAVELRALIDATAPPARHAAGASWVGPDGTATLTHEDLLLVLGALRTALDVADTDRRFELAALAYRLGDDR